MSAVSAKRPRPGAARASGGVRDRLCLMGKRLPLLLVLLLGGCGLETDGPLASLAGTPPTVPAANAAGHVTNALDGTDVAGATVGIGDLSTTTDSDGKFELDAVAAGRNTLVHVSAPGYVETYAVTNTVSGYTAQLLVQLLPIAETTVLVGASGGTAGVSGTPAQVDLPGNALALADGSTAAGNVDIDVTPINMAQNLTAAPGDFTDSAGAALQSFGGLATTASDDGTGDSVDLASGQTATIRIPFSSRNTDPAPATLTLYRFDPAAGHWVAGGTATLAGTDPDQYYEGSIDRLGIWMAAAALSPVVYLNGCVVNEGSTTRVGNVRVQAEGISYSGISAATTDASGKFRMPILSDGSVIVNGQLGEYVTNTFSAGPGTSDITMPACLSLAALSGAPRVTLTWGASPTDVDSHIFAPDGTHVYYGDLGTLEANPYIKLDVDDITSYGPEVMTLTRLMVGTYTYGVHNFTRSAIGSTTGLTDSPVRVELRRGSNLTVFSPTLAMGEIATDTWWVVFTMTVDADCNVTITPVNAFSTGDSNGPASPALPAPVTREYCVPPS